MFETLTYFLELSVSIYFFTILVLFVVNVCEFTPVSDLNAKDLENHIELPIRPIKTGDMMKSSSKDGHSKMEAANNPIVLKAEIKSDPNKKTPSKLTVKSDDRKSLKDLVTDRASASSVKSSSAKSSSAKSSSAKSDASKLVEESKINDGLTEEMLKVQVANAIDSLQTDEEKHESASENQNGQNEEAQEAEDTAKEAEDTAKEAEDTAQQAEDAAPAADEEAGNAPNENPQPDT